jgi:RHS repeat-associated protein
LDFDPIIYLQPNPKKVNPGILQNRLYDYSYAFNGMETDKEVSGTGNSYTTQFRQYDPRLGRWKSLDPLAGKYPGQSPFAAFNNNPLYFVDPLGLEGEPTGGDDDIKKGNDLKPVDVVYNPDVKSTVGQLFSAVGVFLNLSDLK